MNARDEHGVVHEVERYPERTLGTQGGLRAAGFTWCMQLFSWADGPRWHVPYDTCEARLERTDEVPSCLECITHPSGIL